MSMLLNKLKSKLRTTQFTAVSILPKDINEIVHLKINGKDELIDVSNYHSPLCLEPLIIGVKIIDRKLIEDAKTFELNYTLINKSLPSSNDSSQSDLLAKMFLIYQKYVEIGEGVGLLMLKVKRTKLYQLSRIKRNKLNLYLYLHYLRKGNKHSIKYLNNLCSLYSYPRKVILNIVRSSSHFNIFPMDFIANFNKEKIILLGLNTENRSLNEIFNIRKMLVADISSENKNIAYGFADHHKKEILESENLPYKFTDSEILKLPVPDFVIGYKEIELERHIKLGSHYLLICKVFNERELRPDEPHLYHIHTIHHLHLSNKGLAFPTV